MLMKNIAILLIAVAVLSYYYCSDTIYTARSLKKIVTGVAGTGAVSQAGQTTYIVYLQYGGSKIYISSQLVID